ncbi:MAG: hypothetical protein HY301_17370 [Verrucomicrobia bacterium]|nr:hypothetical protein [Verrucomicrobiota bacterium]
MPDSSPAKFRFRPKLIESLRSYTRADFLSDLGAGATVGVVALSLAMALGIASNSTPAAGIYTAIVAGFLISALGGSKVSIGGPTAAFIPIVVAVAAKYGAANLVICTMMAGVMLFAMGVFLLLKLWPQSWGRSSVGSILAVVPETSWTSAFSCWFRLPLSSCQKLGWAGCHHA